MKNTLTAFTSGFLVVITGLSFALAAPSQASEVVLHSRAQLAAIQKCSNLTPQDQSFSQCIREQYESFYTEFSSN